MENCRQDVFRLMGADSPEFYSVLKHKRSSPNRLRNEVKAFLDLSGSCRRVPADFHQIIVNGVCHTVYPTPLTPEQREQEKVATGKLYGEFSPEKHGGTLHAGYAIAVAAADEDRNAAIKRGVRQGVAEREHDRVVSAATQQYHRNSDVLC
jgi:hypothetical protein